MFNGSKIDYWENMSLVLTVKYCILKKQLIFLLSTLICTVKTQYVTHTVTVLRIIFHSISMIKSQHAVLNGGILTWFTF